MSAETVTITPQAGDVLLSERPPSHTPNDISELIRKATGSPYSHILAVMGPGEFAEATPGERGEADVGILTAEQLPGRLAVVRRLDLFRPNALGVDEHVLRREIRCFIDRSTPQQPGHDPEVMFSMGSAATLAALQQLQRRIRDEPISGSESLTDLLRWERALFCALENGDRRLFCSEFVYIVLDRANERPWPPPDPSLDTGRFPTDEPVGLLGAGDWFREQARKLSEKIFHDPDAIKTIEEEWNQVSKAYESDCEPKQLHIANYFTPADFSWSPTFTRIARRTKDRPDWFPIKPMPTDKKDPV